MRNDRRPVARGIVTPPGEHLADTLRALSIEPQVLARRMKRPARFVLDLCSGAESITAETAVKLEKALGVDAEVWVNLEAGYRLTQARQRAARLATRARATR